MPMHCDNQDAIYTGNSNFHEHMQHIEMDYRYSQDKVMSRVISTPHVISSHQVVDIFMKILAGISYGAMCTKLGIFDLYFLA